MWRTGLAAFFALILTGPALAQGLTVSPIRIESPPQGGPNSILIGSQLEQPITVQVRAFRWTQTDGEDHLAPDPDLRLAPEIFTISPGKAQTIRMLVPNTEGTGNWRLVIDELPTPSSAGPVPANGPTQLNIRIRYVLPMFSSTAAPADALSIRREEDGITLTNHGKGYLRLHDMALTHAGGERVPTSPPLVYILPGASISVRDGNGSPDAEMTALHFRIDGNAHTRDLKPDP